MHHTHTSRPPHLRHNVHQTAPPPQMHPPPHPSQPPVGINVGPPHVGPPPPPPTIQQQHHVTNIPPPNLHGAPPPQPQQITPYIPPHQRDSNRLNHHAQQRINSQMHQIQVKNRIHNVNLTSGGNGISTTVPVVNSNGPPPPPQQQHNAILQQQKHQTLLQKNNILTKSTIHQQQPSHPQSHNTHHHNHHQQQQQQLSKHPPQSYQPNHSSLSSPLPQRQQQQNHPPPPPLPSPSTSSSSHQQTVLQQQQQQQQHNIQSMHQPKAILSQKSNLQQQHQKAPQLQITNPQSQSPIVILQKNQPQNVQHQQHHQQQQQKLNHNQNTQQQCSTSVSQQQQQQQQQQHQVQQKVSKIQPVHHNTVNSCGGSNNGGGGGSGVGNNSNHVSSNTSNMVQQHQHQQQQQQQNQRQVEPQQLQQQSSVQSNQIITSSQNSQATTTNRISANNENKSNSTIPQQQQQQQPDKTDENGDLICGNNQFQSTAINETLANTKEKTPMCLVNELARFNKIQHQYRLTGEQGPAHSKRFTVTLKLGEEEYTAEGPSIKKAQHSAAAEAVCRTKYTHPPMKSSRLKNGRASGGAGNITPTVELNALAMKLGKPTVYVFDAPQPHPSIGGGQHSSQIIPPSGSGQQQPLPPSSSLHYHSYHQPQQQQQQQHQQYHNGGVISTVGTNPQTTALPVTGTAQMNGGGTTKSTTQNLFSMHISNHTYFQENHHYQSYSRNNSMNIYQPPAARFANTFQSRRSYSARGGGGGFFKYNQHPRMTAHNGMPSASREMCRITLMVGKQKFIGIGDTPQAARHDAAARALEVLRPLVSSDESNEMNTSNIDDTNSDLKSPISLVHEIALKRNLPVTFEVKLEKGPPHMKTFVTICRVGNIMTEGEGNGKKISKKRAAEKMLEELKSLPPLSPFKSNTQTNVTRVKNIKRKPQIIKKRTKNIIKDNSESDNHDDVNPISKLIQIQQALKEREPVYTLIEEKGAPRRREFVIEVSAGGHIATGSGPNKKMAKKLAAKNLLILMGYDNMSPNKENNSKVANVANGIETINKNCNETTIDKATTVMTPTKTVLKTTNQGGSAGRQIVPGLLLMQQQPSIKILDTEIDSISSNQISTVSSIAPVSSTSNNNNSTNTITTSESSSLSSITSSSSSSSSSTAATTATAVSLHGTKDDHNNSFSSTSTTSENTIKSNLSTFSTTTSNSSNFDGVRPKDQLLYLADLLGFQVAFSDYPKGNHTEYLTIVTLSTDPPQICHGTGNDADASQDHAALAALKMLSNLGLDNVKPKKINNNDVEGKKSLITTSGVSKD